MGLSRCVACFVGVIGVCLSASAQIFDTDRGPPYCAEDNLWRVYITFTEKLTPNDQPVCYGAWDCISQSTMNPDIKVCLNGRCNDIDNTNLTDRPCRDSRTCHITDVALREEQLVVQLADEDAISDDELETLVFPLRSQTGNEAGFRQAAMSMRYAENQTLRAEAFRGNYGIADVQIEPSKGWIACSVQDETRENLLDRVLGVDIDRMMQDPECAGAMQNTGIFAARSRQGNLGPGSPGILNIFNTLFGLSRLYLNADQIIEAQRPPEQWSRETWESVIRWVDDLPNRPEAYDTRATAVQAAILKNCLGRDAPG